MKNTIDRCLEKDVKPQTEYRRAKDIDLESIKMEQILDCYYCVGYDTSCPRYRSR